MEIGDRIRKKREELGMSQEELAKKIGYRSRSSINKIENGAYTKSSNENIIKFRDYLNDHGIVATIRRELGSDIDAACGQLRRQNLQS